MPRTGWRRIRIGAALLLAAAVLACNTPTIPIPPLRAPTFDTPAQDVWRASGGGAAANSEVVVIDRATGEGVVTRADGQGAYATATFAGRAGDTIELYYRTPAGEVSPSICAPLEVGTPTLVTCP